MFDDNPAPVFHSNRYNADSACEHCGGVVRHEPWCITVDRMVCYAYEIVADASKLTFADRLILHAMSVVWESNRCRGKCQG